MELDGDANADASNRLEIEQANHQITQQKLREMQEIMKVLINKQNNTASNQVSEQVETEEKKNTTQQDHLNLQLQLELYQDREALAQREMEEYKEQNYTLQEKNQQLQRQMKELQSHPPPPPLAPMVPNLPTTIAPTSPTTASTVLHFLNIPSPILLPTTSTTTTFNITTTSTVDLLDNDNHHAIPLTILAKLGDDPKSRAGRRRAEAKHQGVSVKRARNRMGSCYSAMGMDVPQRMDFTTTSAAKQRTSTAAKRTVSPKRTTVHNNTSPSSGGLHSSPAKVSLSSSLSYKKTSPQNKQNWRGGGSRAPPNSRRTRGVAKSNTTIQENLKRLEKTAKLSLQRSMKRSQQQNRGRVMRVFESHSQLQAELQAERQAERQAELDTELEVKQHWVDDFIFLGENDKDALMGNANEYALEFNVSDGQEVEDGEEDVAADVVPIASNTRVSSDRRRKSIKKAFAQTSVEDTTSFISATGFTDPELPDEDVAAEEDATEEINDRIDQTGGSTLATSLPGLPVVVPRSAGNNEYNEGRCVCLVVFILYSIPSLPSFEGTGMNLIILSLF